MKFRQILTIFKHKWRLDQYGDGFPDESEVCFETAETDGRSSFLVQKLDLEGAIWAWRVQEFCLRISQDKQARLGLGYQFFDQFGFKTEGDIGKLPQQNLKQLVLGQNELPFLLVRTGVVLTECLSSPLVINQSSIKKKSLLIRWNRGSHIIICESMAKLTLLAQEYASYAGKETLPQLRAKIKDFQLFILKLAQSDHSPLKIRFASSHARFLLIRLLNPKSSSALSFTFAIQILNFLLHRSPHFRFEAPPSLMQSLRDHLKAREDDSRSAAVISNVVWLIGKCIQGSSNRERLVQSLCDSRLLELCLQAPKFESTTQAGLCLLLTYMSKRGLINGSFALNLVPNLNKFIQDDSKRELLALLKSLGITSLQEHPQLLLPLSAFLASCFKQQQLLITERQSHWELVLQTQALAGQELQLKWDLKPMALSLINMPALELAEATLNRTVEVALSLPCTLEQLELCFGHLLSNSLARRLFIHLHDSITPAQFLRILQSDLPSSLAQQTAQPQQHKKNLKLIICLKRAARRLGLQSFYTLRFGKVEEALRKSLKDCQGVEKDLFDLWKELTPDQSEKDCLWSWQI